MARARSAAWIAVAGLVGLAAPALAQDATPAAPTEGAGEPAPTTAAPDAAAGAEAKEGAKDGAKESANKPAPEKKSAGKGADAGKPAAEGAKPGAPEGKPSGIVVEEPTGPPPVFVDQDKDQSPSPVVHDFKGDLLNFKVGTGMAFAQTSPFGARSGYGNVFTEGDWAVFGTGVGLHWDLELRAGLGLFEQRGSYFQLPQLVTQQNNLVDNPGDLVVTVYGENSAQCRPAQAGDQPVGGFDPYTPPEQQFVSVIDGQVRDVNCEKALSFYRRQLIFATGRNTDYFRIDKLWLSYDYSFFGVDVGRVRTPEARSVIYDGVQLRFDFQSFRFGMFGGFRPNPWHQQVVGASSGGFVPLEVFGPAGSGGGPFEYFQVGWGQVYQEDAYSPTGATTGPYSNDVGLGYPWLQFGSVRFPTAGAWGSLRMDPVFTDIALVTDLFGDPWWYVDDTTGVLTRDENGGFLSAATPLGIDRVWLHTSGGVRVFEPLTISWRGTLDLIGARPLMPRDLFLDATWRNLGPVTLSATYLKINTLATAYSFYRFFRPLENAALAQQQVAAAGGAMPLDGLNNGNLFVVDRDRLMASASMFLWSSLQGYLDLVGERRNDFAYVYAPNPADAYGNLGTALGGLADGESFMQQFQCAQAVQRNGDGSLDAPNGALIGSNPTVPTYADRCRIGLTVGLRDAFLANIGTFDLHASHMQGYFASTTRVAGTIGVSALDVLWLQVGAAAERNNLHRVYAPVCDDKGYCPPNYVPADGRTHSVAQFGFVPQGLASYQLSADFSWRIFAGWYLEGGYFGWVEEIPYQGDYWDFFGTGPLDREPYQITHTLMIRTLYKHF